MDQHVSTPHARGLFTPPDGDALYIARFLEEGTRIVLEAPDALTLARWVAALGTRDGQAAVISPLVHAYGIHLAEVPRHARTLVEAGLDEGPPPGGFTLRLSQEPDVSLSVDTDVSLVGLLACFERVLGPTAAAGVLESVAERLAD